MEWIAKKKKKKCEGEAKKIVKNRQETAHPSPLMFEGEVSRQFYAFILSPHIYLMKIFDF